MNLESTITITIYVDAAAAVRAGNAQAGPVKLRLTADDIRRLNATQRETLAKHLEWAGNETESPCWGDPLSWYAPPVGDASWSTFVRLLDWREAVMRCRKAGA